MVSESELMSMASKRPKNTSAKARPCRAWSAGGVEAPVDFAGASGDEEGTFADGAAATDEAIAAFEAAFAVITAIDRLFLIRGFFLF